MGLLVLTCGVVLCGLVCRVGLVCVLLWILFKDAVFRGGFTLGLVVTCLELLVGLVFVLRYLLECLNVVLIVPFA